MKDADSALGAPVNVFTEITNPHRSENRKSYEQIFVFAGAYSITRIQYLMPRTPLLIKMLESKFTGPTSDRSEEAWNRSLNLKWAVVDLTKVEGEGDKESNPMEPLKEIKKKSVSELLEEMRLQESSTANQNGNSGLEGAKEEIHADENS